MEYTVRQVARISGVTVRTLHYYDQIELLSPGKNDRNSYRLYGQTDLERLQQILFYRELDFGLDEIKRMLNDPEFDRTRALEQHRELLTLKRTRLDGLIDLVETTINDLKGKVSFMEFDMTEIEKAKQQYSEEAEERWGNTDAYKESTRKTAKYTKDDWARISADAKGIYDGFAELMRSEVPAGDDRATGLAKQWQEHISRYFYRCSDEILAGLGQMYVDDERFRVNINKNAEGLAEYMSAAIRAYLHTP